MSPRRANSFTVRDSLIRTLAPGLMRAYGINREQAKEVLASLTEDERYTLFRLKAKCKGKRSGGVRASVAEETCGGTMGSRYRVVGGRTVRVFVRRP